MSENTETYEIAALEKNATETLKISLSVFNGHRLVNARIFAPYKDGGSGPTAKGVALKVGMLPALIQALSEAHAKALSLGWCDDGGAR